MEHWHDLINWLYDHQEPVILITNYMRFIITSRVFFRKKEEKPTQLSQVDSSPSVAQDDINPKTS
jgi:hypothetical protein